MTDDPTRTLTIPSDDGSKRGFRVTVVRGNAVSTPSSSERVVIGRGENADLRLDDPAVSLFHAELAADSRGVRVKDLESRNGTRAGGVSIVEAIVDYGTELTLGGAVVRVEPAVAASPGGATSFGGLVGTSRAMREVYTLLERIAPTSLSVLLEGPTGSGKEVAARALHARGRRPDGPFVVVDCTTIPPALAESILFGHERGAFTGANTARVGLLEAASGGTVFFDELGDLPRELQPKLLGALERREIVPVGGTKPRALDLRVISATLHDLRAMVNRGEFREDLYYRVAQARVRLPSLAERPDDVRGLVQHFLATLPFDVPAARAIAPDALDAIAERRFDGNVRELKSTVERVAMIAVGSSITRDDLAFERLLVDHDRRPVAASVPAPAAPSSELEPFKDAKRSAIEDFERGYLERLIEKTGLNISRAAALAGIERQTLRDLLRKHGLREEGGEAADHRKADQTR